MAFDHPDTNSGSPPPEYDPIDFGSYEPDDGCVVCNTTDVAGKYKGEKYCDTHLQERMAQDIGVGY